MGYNNHYLADYYQQVLLQQYLVLAFSYSILQLKAKQRTLLILQWMDNVRETTVLS